MKLTKERNLDYANNSLGSTIATIFLKKLQEEYIKKYGSVRCSAVISGSGKEWNVRGSLCRKVSNDEITEKLWRNDWVLENKDIICIDKTSVDVGLIVNENVRSFDFLIKRL
ncbi:MAG: hypothetical protein QXP53_00080 [Candidatus Pacearchaeota archaeon]